MAECNVKGERNGRCSDGQRLPCQRRPAPAPTTAPPPASSRERTVYAAGGGRKFAFSFIFLILLPFFISLPPMLFWRISQGHWQGTLGLLVLAIGFTFIMFLLFIEVMHSLMTRIELGGTR